MLCQWLIWICIDGPDVGLATSRSRVWIRGIRRKLLTPWGGSWPPTPLAVPAPDLLDMLDNDHTGREDVSSLTPLQQINRLEYEDLGGPIAVLAPSLRWISSGLDVAAETCAGVAASSASSIADYLDSAAADYVQAAVSPAVDVLSDLNGDDAVEACEVLSDSSLDAADTLPLSPLNLTAADVEWAEWVAEWSRRPAVEGLLSAASHWCVAAAIAAIVAAAAAAAVLSVVWLAMAAAGAAADAPVSTAAPAGVFLIVLGIDSMSSIVGSMIGSLISTSNHVSNSIIGRIRRPLSVIRTHPTPCSSIQLSLAS